MLCNMCSRTLDDGVGMASSAPVVNRPVGFYVSVRKCFLNQYGEPFKGQQPSPILSIRVCGGCADKTAADIRQRIYA